MLIGVALLALLVLGLLAIYGVFGVAFFLAMREAGEAASTRRAVLYAAFWPITYVVWKLKHLFASLLEEVGLRDR